jgi:hypothetical protein
MIISHDLQMIVYIKSKIGQSVADECAKGGAAQRKK